MRCLKCCLGISLDFEMFIIIFILSTSVPPSIVNEGTVEDVKVKERQNIILACEVTGK